MCYTSYYNAKPCLVFLPTRCTLCGDWRRADMELLECRISSVAIVMVCGCWLIIRSLTIHTGWHCNTCIEVHDVVNAVLLHVWGSINAKAHTCIWICRSWCSACVWMVVQSWVCISYCEYGPLKYMKSLVKYLIALQWNWVFARISPNSKGFLPALVLLGLEAVCVFGRFKKCPTYVRVRNAYCKQIMWSENCFPSIHIRTLEVQFII